tara:strand:+ start:19536 stop:20273 length:738 start_codon:yes stop_codon:yes gene_type:complete
MIILHDYKLIFLKPRKVAGTSLEIALSKFSNNDKDIITQLHKIDENIRKDLNFSAPKNFRYTIKDIHTANFLLSLKTFFKKFNFPIKFKNHNSARYIKENLTDTIWNTYKRISIVRNPYDYLISYYFWKIRKEETKKESFRHYEFVEWCYKNLKVINRNYSQYFINGEDIIDYYIRFENFENDLINLENETKLNGLYSIFLTLNAKSGYKPKKINYDKFFFNNELNELIYEKNLKIFNKFNYKKI